VRSLERALGSDGHSRPCEGVGGHPPQTRRVQCADKRDGRNGRPDEAYLPLSSIRRPAKNAFQFPTDGIFIKSSLDTRLAASLCEAGPVEAALGRQTVGGGGRTRNGIWSGLTLDRSHRWVGRLLLSGFGQESRAEATRSTRSLRPASRSIVSVLGPGARWPGRLGRVWSRRRTPATLFRIPHADKRRPAAWGLVSRQG